MVEEDSLETTGIDVPDLEKIQGEIERANTDSSVYRGRMQNTRSWWFNEWPNQTIDGRMWSPGVDGKFFPWRGCSDSRLRIVSTIVQEFVTLCLAAFWSAKKQVKSIRPLVSGKESNVAQNMLDWRMGQMKRELLHELPMALAWRFGAGLSFLKIEWEQIRELIYVPLSMDMIGQLSAALGLGDVMDMILDPDKAYDKQLIPILQKLSPILPTDEARSILNGLRTTGQAQLPTVNLRVNKPKWTAKRPFVDFIFPSETADIQQSRFTCERELVSEVELTDRIATEGYDPDFVEAALGKKGQFAGWWMTPSSGVADIHGTQYMGSNRDLVELNHFLSWKLDNGVPCLYRTVFNQAVIGDDLYAVHRKFEYDHGQFPFVALRRTYTFRPLLSSIGIAEEAYTDELDIKRQQDGLNNRTDLIHKPPMIVPLLRAQATANDYGPNAVMTATRPGDVQWPPLPPMDQTPVIVIQMVQDRIDRRYAITGGNVDPQIVALRRQQVTNEVNSELELALEQTVQLQEQFEKSEDVQKVAGGDQWEYGRKEIQGQYTVSAAIDINLIDIERAKMKLDMLAQLLPFKQEGAVFNAAVQLAVPEFADSLIGDQTSPQAIDKETTDEYNAISQIKSGIEARFPLQANPQLRLQIIQQILSDPETMQGFQQDEVAQKRLQNRMKSFQNQINQYQNNPVIGRQLATQTFAPSQPANVSMGQS